MRCGVLAAAVLLLNVMGTQAKSARASAQVPLQNERHPPKAKEQLVKGDNILERQKDRLKAIELLSGGGDDKWKGWLGVFGGALCHLALGSTYCWGNFLPYAPNYIKYLDGQPHTDRQPDAMYVLPGAFVAQMATMPFGQAFQKRLGCRGTTLLGCWLMALGVIGASYARDLISFMLCYSILFGAGVGIAYTAPMVNGWIWFPEQSGLISGCVVAGFGAGGFIFNKVGSQLINPKGLNPTDGVFPDEVTSAFPHMLRSLGIIYLVLTTLGSALITPPHALKSKAANTASSMVGWNLKDAVKSKPFWLLWTMALLNSLPGINTAGGYKQFGSSVEILRDDRFLSLVGSLGALGNGAGRLFWGSTIDSMGFKKPFAALATLQTINMFLYPIATRSRTLFTISTVVAMSCLGGNFAMFPAITAKIFGPRAGPAIYGVLFSGFAAASIIGITVAKALAQKLGWAMVWRAMSALSVIVLAVLSMFQDPK